MSFVTLTWMQIRRSKKLKMPNKIVYIKKKLKAIKTPN